MSIYKQVCEESLDLLAMITTELSATFTFPPTAFERVLGYSSKKVVEFERSFFDLIVPVDIETMREQLALLTNTCDPSRDSVVVQHRIMTVDRSTMYCASTSFRITPKGCVCVTRL